jgi:hypothetical protein
MISSLSLDSDRWGTSRRKHWHQLQAALSTWSPADWKHWASPKALTKVATFSELHSDPRLHTPIDNVFHVLSPPLPPFLCLVGTRSGRVKKKKLSRGRGGVKSEKNDFALPSGVLRGGLWKLKGVWIYRYFTGGFKKVLIIRASILYFCF